ncbi:MAG: phosphatase PAP2 family protein [Dysgonamonadaceae bacterium]|jgi:undecaprenyl-diphosphatase|nr:phosphatase PAP2 family protein [Dysgonamonadaceae bacterium]
MLERELQWELDLFACLNGSNSAFWDSFFYLYSYQWTWIPFYLCLLFVFIYRKTGAEIKKDRKEILGTIVSVILVIALCDQISSGICKPLFHRFRPTHHPDFQDWVNTVLDYRGGLYGFASGHAANTFGLATFTALLFRNRLATFTLLLFALITGYSRIYLGVHFISDVVAGALIGIVMGYAVFLLYHKIIKPSGCVPPPWKIRLLSAVYSVSVIILCFFSVFFRHYLCFLS